MAEFLHTCERSATLLHHQHIDFDLRDSRGRAIGMRVRVLRIDDLLHLHDKRDLRCWRPLPFPETTYYEAEIGITRDGNGYGAWKSPARAVTLTELRRLIDARVERAMKRQERNTAQKATMTTDNTDPIVDPQAPEEPEEPERALSLPEQLADLKARLGLSQSQLARAIGIDPSTLRRYLSGAQTCPLHILLAVRCIGYETGKIA